jgi:hypothetical protein
MRSIARAFMLLVLILVPLAAATVQVPLTAQLFEGSTLAPGSRVVVEPGERPTLKIQGLRGSPEQPITVINGTGLVRVANTDRGFAISISDCQHVRFTGSGQPGLEYGFSAQATRDGMMAVHIVGRSSDIEIDHVEVTGAGFAGFNIKDEPRADGSTNRDHFVMHNIEVHHNYVHDVNGEGFYIGHTFYDGHKQKDGSVLFPHVIEGLRIHHNRTERTGCEGIQVGSSIGRLEITDNVIIQPGIKPFAQWQDNGLQVNAAGDILVARNVIIGPPGNGIIGGPLRDDYRIRIERNLVVDPGGLIGYLGGADRGKGGIVEIVNNTFVGGRAGGYKVANNNLARCVAMNNLLVAINGPTLQLGGKERIDQGNLVIADLAQAGVSNPSEGDGELLPHSPAIGQGKLLAGVTPGADPLGRVLQPGDRIDVGAWAPSAHDPSREAKMAAAKSEPAEKAIAPLPENWVELLASAISSGLSAGKKPGFSVGRSQLTITSLDGDSLSVSGIGMSMALKLSQLSRAQAVEIARSLGDQELATRLAP